MDIAHFELPVEFKGQRFIASCQKFTVHKRPQYWITLPKKEKEFPATTFYEMEDNNFFWFQLPTKGRQRLAKKIVESLKSYIAGNPEIKDKGIIKHQG